SHLLIAAMRADQCASLRTLGAQRMRDVDPSAVVKDALSVIGQLGPRTAQDKLRKAQGLLYEAQRQKLDPERIRAAASLIRRTAVSLMKVAAGLNKCARKS